MKIELCVPAHNEAETIVRALTMLKATLPKDLSISLVVSENGSTDGTAELVENSCLENVLVLRTPGKGKGLAIRTAALRSDADIFGFIDADLSADPRVIPEMISRIMDGADLVIGSRLLKKEFVHRGFLRTLSSQVFNLLVRVMLEIRFSDTQCGLKFMNVKARKVLERIEEDGWFFDLELLAIGSKRNFRIEEIPVNWEEFRFPERKSKLRMFSDGLDSFRTMKRIRSRIIN